MISWQRNIYDLMTFSLTKRQGCPSDKGSQDKATDKLIWSCNLQCKEKLTVSTRLLESPTCQLLPFWSGLCVVSSSPGWVYSPAGSRSVALQPCSLVALLSCHVSILGTNLGRTWDGRSHCEVHQGSPSHSHSHSAKFVTSETLQNRIFLRFL